MRWLAAIQSEAGGSYLKGHDFGLAAQGIAGLSIRVSDRMSWLLDYRLRGIFDIESRAEFSPSVPSPDCGGPVGDCGTVAIGGKNNLLNHILSVGVRIDLD